ncbi:molybdopterin cofactor-binding domain-containing protein [Streptomyces wuyuanensis]|uniref:molybdopterin cofactor-binding domain-containing protein n=1 Tax=Streptomyces wuyuanensis TaxID=1196353 RepID=UPI0034460611
MANEVSFFLNGERVKISDPSPNLLLIDYLRSSEVGLTGAKKACGQGGCGSCTVILSQWDANEKKIVHRAINSCLRPVCALAGLSVTTVEGTSSPMTVAAQHLMHRAEGSRYAAPIDAPIPPAFIESANEARTQYTLLQTGMSPTNQYNDDPSPEPVESTAVGVNPVAHRLALNNGSQCGYCTTGFVMNMTEFISTCPEATKKEIEGIFDGNLCRCTGYRPILTGMKTFASDWSSSDEENRMVCQESPETLVRRPATQVSIPFPDEAKNARYGVTVDGSSQSWSTPKDFNELAAVLSDSRVKNERVRLVCANTSFGIYEHEYSEVDHFVDINGIAALRPKPKLDAAGLTVGAGITYTELIEHLEKGIESVGPPQGPTLEAFLYMSKRTAGRILRNAASLGGNIMLALDHIAQVRGEPFPSDIFTPMVAANAEVSYQELIDGHFQAQKSVLSTLVTRVVADPSLTARIVLTGFTFPVLPDSLAMAQKVALREVNSHTIVNATSVLSFQGPKPSSASLVFAGIAPFPWHAKDTENHLCSGPLLPDKLKNLCQILQQETTAELEKWRERAAGLVSEGFTDTYRVDLVVAMFYKTLVNAMIHQDVSMPSNVRSAGVEKWGSWSPSGGSQKYSPDAEKRPVRLPYVRSTALSQALGETHYTQEIPAPPRTLNAAFVQSRCALGRFSFWNPQSESNATVAELSEHLASRYPSFARLITKDDVPKGGMNLQGLGMDQPLFADNKVLYVGQSLALVLADTQHQAIEIAQYVTNSCVTYEEIGWAEPWDEPIISLPEAIERNSVYPDNPKSAPHLSHIWRITRAGSNFSWMSDKRALDRDIKKRNATVQGATCIVVETTQQTGGQAHFYLETHACLAVPVDEGRMIVHPSSQSPMGTHQGIAMALGVPYNKVDVHISPLGGGFGGKTEPVRFTAGPVAVAANSVKRPVRLAMSRDSDTSMIGKRHAYYGQCQIAVDSGIENTENRGIIRGLHAKMWGDGGAFYDVSYIVSNCIQTRSDNAYNVPNFESQIDVCRTNTAPSTAMRAFGDIQAKNILENAIEDAAVALGMSPEEVREKNLYKLGDSTPFGQVLDTCYIRQVWSLLKDTCNFEGKRREVEEFNRQNKWRKRGISMIPVKYGSGYNLKQIEQAAAMIVVSQVDGTIVIHHGGVDMGQGLVTQALQVAGYVLNVPMEMIHIEKPHTSVTPNPTSSGASTGTPYTCEAVKSVCEDLRKRLEDFGRGLLAEQGQAWCEQQGINFWDKGEEGWAAKVTIGGRTSLVWQNLVRLAYVNRVSLVCALNTQIHGGEKAMPGLTFKPKSEQPSIPDVDRENVDASGNMDEFVGWTYSAACSVAEVDILTGEVKIISSDIMYDMGRSMNPAIDIGQIEGAFVQGIGCLLTEKLVFNGDGEEKGRLETVNTWRYKIPAHTTIPLEFNVHLFPRSHDSVKNISEYDQGIFSAKEVGEPPIVLANTVFFAVKSAVRASRVERGLDPMFQLNAPATVQDVREACMVRISDL